jgi:hypothetical protein
MIVSRIVFCRPAEQPPGNGRRNAALEAVTRWLSAATLE